MTSVYLFRQPIAESIGRAACAQQHLSCSLKVTRLDLGGITLSGLDVRAPGAHFPAFSAGRLSVDLGWSNPFSPRPSLVDGDDLMLRVNLSGVRPVLGDLDALARSLPAGDGGGPIPRITINNFRVVADTLLGPVETQAFIAMNSPEDFRVSVKTAPLSMAISSARIELAAAELDAVARGGALNARARVDLSSFEGPGMRVADFVFVMNVVQDAGGMTGAGDLRLREAVTRDQSFNMVSADARLEAAPLDLGAITPDAALAALKTLTVQARSGEGAVAGYGWRGMELSLTAERGGGGTMAAHVDGFSHNAATAERMAVRADLVLDASGGLAADGAAEIHGAALAGVVRRDLAEAIRKFGADVFPGFAPALSRTVDNAAAAFDVVAPWRVSVLNGDSSAALLDGLELRAASGFTITADNPAQSEIANWTNRNGWSAAGVMRMSGGGGPQATVTLAEAMGAAGGMKARADIEVRPWRVADETLSLRMSGLSFEAAAGAGRAAGDVMIGMSGDIAGGAWRGARANGAVNARWSADAFIAEAPQGLMLAWDEGRYGETVIGAGSLRYQARGALARSANQGLAGSGVLSAAEFPVSGAAFTARAALGSAKVDWTLAGALRASFDSEPVRFWLLQGDGAVPVVIDDISGMVNVSDGWSVHGRLSGGRAEARDISVSGLSAGFDLAGRGGSLNGKLSDVELAITDLLPEDTRRFEAAAFSGAASLAGGVADFSGVFALQASGVQLAAVSGRHDLYLGSGALSFAPTPLIFQPRVFQPSALSPLLRGPANVTGRVDVSGGASWGADGFAANARMQLRRVGFALAGAGVFEGVSGDIVISDLMAMTSGPGQEISIERVTLGMPIEKGVAKFQMIGFDAVRLESITWPFAGGEIRVAPVDFGFGAEENRVIAEAVNWDLRQVIEQFKIPDIRVQGKVNGSFPVVFRTGSARVDNAVLEASREGGVIQYSGATTETAGEADANARMLFDALKDFHYRVLKMTLDGDLAGRMVLNLALQGSNPAVMRGQTFDLNISVDSPLVDLLSAASRTNAQVDAVVRGITGVGN